MFWQLLEKNGKYQLRLICSMYMNHEMNHICNIKDDDSKNESYLTIRLNANIVLLSIRGIYVSYNIVVSAHLFYYIGNKYDNAQCFKSEFSVVIHIMLTLCFLFNMKHFFKQGAYH